MLARGAYSQLKKCMQPLLWFLCLALMKSLLSSDIAAQAPSSTMIMKQSFPLLRVIGLSAGLVASAAMMPSVHAATSATITATGNVPVACDVTGAQITMAKISAKNLVGTATGIQYAAASGTIFSLTTPTLVAPSGYGGVASVSVLKNGNTLLFMTSEGDGSSYVATAAESGEVSYEARVDGGMADVVLMPGNYTISTTLTCIGQ